MCHKTKGEAIILGLTGSGLSAARQLGRRGVRVTALTWGPPDVARSTRFCHVVQTSDPSLDSAAFAAALESIASSLDSTAVLIPAADEAVVFLNSFRDSVPSNCVSYVQPLRVAEALVDKWKQTILARSEGIRVPRTYAPRSLSDVSSMTSELGYPAIIRPAIPYEWRRHMPGKGIEVHGPVELLNTYETLLALGVPTIVQSVIEGPSTTLTSVCCHVANDGSVKGLFSQRKIRQYPIDFGVGSLVESTSCPTLEAEVIRFLTTIGYRGTAEIEYKVDERDGQPNFIELNARIWTQHGLAAACGVDFAWLQYLDLTGQEVPELRPATFGRRWISLWDDCFAARDLIRRGDMSFSAWPTSLLSVRAFNTFAWDDPAPAARLWASHVAGLPRALSKRLVFSRQSSMPSSENG